MEKDPYKYFRVEARELVGELGKAILNLEKHGSEVEQVARILRLAHTLKGAARVVKQRDIADVAHAMEDALASYRDSKEPFPREAVDGLLTMLDDIQAHVEALNPPTPDGGGSSQADEVPPAAFRPDLAEVEALLRSVAEAQASLAGIKVNLSTLKALEKRIDLLTQVRGGLRRTGEKGDAGNRIQSIGTELRGSFAALERALTAAADQLGRDLGQIGAAAERLQLIPVDAMFNALERVARDAAQTLGKGIDFQAKGGDLRLDPQLLATAQSALAQLVRNAVAHGIETGEERRARGKPVRGTVTVEVARRGRQIAFICCDDGRGVDLVAVRQVAEAKGITDPGLRELDVEALLQLLLRGGISTAGKVTGISGRGIGLDIVREAAERMRGEVKVRTEAGEGTVVELMVPMATASLPALRVETAGQTVTIPLDAVRRITRIAPEDIAGTAHGQTALYDGQAVPLASLSAILAGRPAAPDRSGPSPVIFVEGDDGMAAITARRLHGIVSAVVKPLPAYTPDIALVTGTSLDARGNPQVMLYPDALVAAARGIRETAEEPRIMPSVLVVDDSLTTRMLEQSILETAGYSVDTAQSGEEALAKVRKHRFGLLLVDVEMPGIDGFALIERLRADVSLRDIPAILVSSRASPEDRRRGEEVGAQGYIVKSEFDQAAFLASVREMAGAA